MIVNGKIIAFQEGMTIEDLLIILNLNSNKVVVELDKEIILKEDFSKTFLKESSKLEIISFVGGG
ncbi:MAG: sulfur carrier protein ThiS [Clostridiales bacterium]|nr:sulfur carrier protein ThiS [Clostridiales bacterium]